jgi:hypothetical protein
MPQPDNAYQTPCSVRRLGSGLRDQRISNVKMLVNRLLLVVRPPPAGLAGYAMAMFHQRVNRRIDVGTG